MTSLIRDVLFPSAAAIGLLAAAIVDTAGADESFYDEPSAVVAAAAPRDVGTSARSSTAVAPAAVTSPSSKAEARADDDRSSGVEARCERTGRIGKFKITRCD